jgi:methylase of polypeptide subunit release factors
MVLLARSEIPLSASAPYRPSLQDPPFVPADQALLALGQLLRDTGYRFTTITPASHNRVVARKLERPVSLEDVFGWSRHFRRGDVPEDIAELMSKAEVLETSGTQLRSTVRFSTLGDQLFVHSAFPTEHAAAVFFGPDTYRFARALEHSVVSFLARSSLRIIDIGSGSGAGGLYAAALLRPASPEVVLTDINSGALRFSRINAALNGVPDVEVIESDLFDAVDGQFDLIISNPPYLDRLQRAYRHGGGELGSALSVRIVEDGIDRLAAGGRLILYTGSAIVDGVDMLHETLRARLKNRGVRFSYKEIDPDVFGEELEQPPYDRADRIAVVVATIDAE